MEKNNQPLEEDAKTMELADKLSAVCVGCNYSTIQYAIQKLYERLQVESVFTGSTSTENADDPDAEKPTHPSE